MAVLFSEESRFHLDQLKQVGLKDFHALRVKMRTRITENDKRLRGIGSQLLKSLEQQGVNSTAFYYGDRGILGIFKSATNGITKEPNSYVLTTLEQDKWYSGKATPAEKVTIDGLKQTMTGQVAEIQEIGRVLKYHQLIFNNIYGVALLEEMSKILQDVQQEKEILHIGEFNHVVSNVVMKESAPFIYERIGYRFNHFLVDEFQDTSVLQWFNLLPLIDESLAHDNLCLVVGDAKQSIYRWRGGDVQQFVELPTIHKTKYLQERLNQDKPLNRLLKEREIVLQDRVKSLPLDTNYRSTKTIVEFNNQLFDGLIEKMPDEFKSMYTGVEQKVFNEDTGLVQIQFIKPEKLTETGITYTERTHEQIRTWIDECIEDGYEPGDIAMLFRGNKEAIQAAQFLIENGYNVVSNESLLINSSPKVLVAIQHCGFNH